MILIGIVVLVALWFILSYNGLINSRNLVKNAWSQIDVQLKRRYDLIPNLVEVVKDYMSYEQETLERVVRARQTAIDVSGVKEQAQAEAQLTASLRQLFALAENYPQLKANENVGRLQEELTTTENKISFARQHYNDSVMRYNTKLQTIPTNMLAGMFSFTAEEFFETEGAERAPVKVDLR